jgi:hypothetical protein
MTTSTWFANPSLIAAKRYYFGVGGGTNAFTAALTSGGAGGAGRLSASETMVIEDGKSNARLVLRVS